jgi:hypothetical protein
LWDTLALNLTFSPEEKEQQSHILVLRMSVRQIQSRAFSKGRRMVLLLLGEKAGMREDMKSKADEARPQTGRVASALCADSFEPQARRYNRIPNSALATNSFPEFSLGWAIGRG